eukprot:562401_1
MHPLFASFLIALIIQSSSDSSWQKSDKIITKLESITNAFIGYYNDEVFILGGFNTENNIIRFPLDISSLHSNTTSHQFGLQKSQSFIQINDSIWMLPYNQRGLSVYDLSTSAFNKPTTYGDDMTAATAYRCLVNYEQYLFIGGGSDSSGHFYASFSIYDITQNEWNTGTVIQVARGTHSCNIVENSLYVIGGWAHKPLDSIEYASFTFESGVLSTTTPAWSYTEDHLITARRQHRSVVFGTDIYVIGGCTSDVTYCPQSQNTLSSVEIIDTVHNTVSQGSELIYGKNVQAVLILDTIIYSFGGYPTGTDNYHYQYVNVITSSPTSAPSNYPTRSPSTAPSNHPTFSPSAAPTNNPSYSPTIAPTNSPTRFPTNVNAYNKKLKALYKLSNLTEANVDYISKTSEDFMTKTSELIETSYVNVPVDDYHLEYRQFQITFHETYYETQTQQFQRMVIGSYIHCESDDVAKLVKAISSLAGFTNPVTDYFRTLTEFNGNKDVEFSAEIMEFNYSINVSESYDFISYSLYGFSAIMALISFVAFKYNTKEGTKTDDSDWSVLLFVSLAISDFVTDISVSAEICHRFATDTGNALLYIAGIGSVIFIILPYTINIYTAVQIETYIAENEIAVLHFKRYRSLFVIVMLFTGSSYISVALFSSRLFALDICNSGLTKFELNKLTNLKLFASVLSENLPQTAIYIIYIIYQNDFPSDIMIMSWVCSWLSIIAAVITYLMGRRTTNYMTIKYKLKLVKLNGNLLKDEKEKVLQNKECKKVLRQVLCQALNIHENMIEFGFAQLSQNGVTIIVLHYVFQQELEQTQSLNGFTFISDLYDSNTRAIGDLLSAHFGFDASFTINLINNHQQEMGSMPVEIHTLLMQ